MPTSPRRIAANRANAARSTGPRSSEGKARSAQNSRKRPFNPGPFTIPRIEDRAVVASLVADAVATYHPINSQERDAVERIALAQHSMRRLSAMEAGFYGNCLEHAMRRPDEPNLLQLSTIAKGADLTLEQGRAFWLAFGFNCYMRQSDSTRMLLRFQTQAERLYRRAVEDFHRLFKLREILGPEEYEAPNEPNVTPLPTTLTIGTTEDSEDMPPSEQPSNEPNTNPTPDPIAPAPITPELITPDPVPPQPAAVAKPASARPSAEPRRKPARPAATSGNARAVAPDE